MRRRPHAAADAPRTRGRRRLAPLAAAAVLLAGCEIPYDFDGTGGADFVVVDPATGEWRDVDLPAPIWTQPSTGHEAPVPGDYDDDGQWEPATVSTTTGLWTTAGGRGSFTVAMPPDTDGTSSTSVVPVPGDYDGDGDTDPAWFSESSATWQIDGGTPFVLGRPATAPSTPAVSGTRFHDIAAPADYDGDGDTDPAVYRVESGDIEVLGGSTIATDVPYGLPVPANYTAAPGDEASVLDLTGRGWMVEGGVLDPSFASGLGAVFPTPADYDGDGIVERAYTTGTSTVTWQVEGEPPRTFPSTSGVTAYLALPFPAHLQIDFLFSVFLSRTCVERIDAGCPGEFPTAMTYATGSWFGDTISSVPAGSRPARGDYDGDGNIEKAAYDPATGQWVTAGGRGTFTFAAPPDIDADPSTSVYPVPHDYDGDGDTDAAFYRDADATWHIDGQAPTQFGRATTATPTFAGTPVHDIPVPGDYDGDGDTDLAVYRIDTGEIVTALGTADPGWPVGDPVTADYDGDGDDDPGLYDPTTGSWYRGGLPTTTPVGAVAGMPVPAQFDGDRLLELTVVADTPLPSEPTTRRWHIPGVLATNRPRVDLPTHGTTVNGRYEVTANHAFVQSYLAGCVLTTPTPGECT